MLCGMLGFIHIQYTCLRGGGILIHPDTFWYVSILCYVEALRKNVEEE